MTVSGTSPPDRTVGRPIAVSVAIVVVVFGVGLFAYYLWDNWWVNWDGGFYLYLGKSLREGHGLAFPDGSPGYFRGPVYPGLFAIGWLVFDVSAQTAIWMSRFVLLAVGGLIAYSVYRAGVGWVWSVMAGVAAVVPSVVMESGGWYFVPDGLAAGLIVLAIAVVALGLPGRSMGLLAGVIVGLGVLAKETAFLYAPIVILVLWPRTTDGARRAVSAMGAFLMGLAGSLLAWVVWADLRTTEGNLRFVPVPFVAAIVLLGLFLVVGALLSSNPTRVADRIPSARPTTLMLIGVPFMIVATVASLSILGEPVVQSLTEGSFEAASRLADSLGWAWIAATLVVLVSILFKPSDDGPASRLWLAGLFLVAIGVGQSWYSGAAALSQRNAVGGIFGIAVLIGVGLSSAAHRGRWPLTVAACALAISFISIAAWKTSDLDGIREGRPSWDNPAVYELNEWMRDSKISEVLVSPIYATYAWFLGGDLPHPELLEMHGASAGSSSYQRGDFCRKVWWAGDKPGCPSGDQLGTATGNRRILGTVFGGAIPSESGPLILTGNVEGGSAFDAAVMVYRIEAFGLGEPIFATREAHLPNWAIVYEVDSTKWADPDVPAVIEPGLESLSGMAEASIPFDQDEFLEMLAEILP